MNDYDALKRLAEKATPGPWTNSGTDTPAQWEIYDGEWAVARAVAYDHNDDLGATRGPGHIDPDANAAFIAAANPETILDLLGELRAAKAQALRDTADRYRGKAKALREVAGIARTQFPMAVDVLLDLADELDRDAAHQEKA